MAPARRDAMFLEASLHCESQYFGRQRPDVCIAPDYASYAA